MPYIKQEYRKEFDEEIDSLAYNIVTLGQPYSGNLNYCITSLILKIIPQLSYNDIATVTGVLENVKQELYRRQFSNYEEKKILENGDLEWL